MALNFNLLAQTPSIASQFAAGQDAGLQAQQMRQQMAAQQQQMSVTTAQLAKMQREEAAMAEMQKTIAANGGPTDLNVAAEAMIKSNIAHYMDVGLKLKQTLAEHEQFRQINGGMTPAPAGPVGAPAGPVGAPGMTPAPALPTPAADALRQAVSPAATPAPINALAPTTASAPAPTNALVAPNQVQLAEMKRKRDAFIALGTPRSLEAARALGGDIVALERQHALPPGSTLVGSSGEVIAQTAQKQEPTETEKLIAALDTASPEKQKYIKARLDYLGRHPPVPREHALRTQQVTMNDGTIGIMNMDTGQVTPASLNGAPVKGKPSAFAEKNAAQRKQMGLDLDRAIVELTDASKNGGLIDQSTGSGAGRLVDAGAAFFGEATPGAIAGGKLAPIADTVLKMVPRFEGPQSDKDTQSYKEAAGQIANTALPNKIRKDAAIEIIRLMKARRGQFVTQAMEAEGVGANAAPPSGVDSSNPLLK